MMVPKIPRFTHEDYEIVERQVPYEGVFRLAKYSIQHRLFDDNWSGTFSREVLERPSAVAVLPYDPELDRVILIQQFRAGAIADPQSPWLIEIVAGCLSGNEKPEDVAVRETEEEAGCIIQALHPLYQYFVSPGGSNEYLHIYVGKIDARDAGGVHGLAEENENINVLNLTTEEALNMLAQGEIKTAPAIFSLQWLAYNRQRLPELWQEIT